MTCHPERERRGSRGLCFQCYGVQRRARRALQPPPPVAADLDQRIETRTDRSAGPEGCWLWTGKITPKGTPMVFDGRRNEPVRRILWNTIHGPMPKGKAAAPSCGTRGCIHPAHLELVHYKSDVTERFWSHVDQSGGPDACWPWKDAASFRNGYGMFRIGWKKPIVQASRHAFEITHGVELKTEEFVMHACDNPPCCNPAHLSKGNALLNNRDMIAKGRAPWQTKKVAGHT